MRIKDEEKVTNNFFTVSY